jgi:hypothetical protein
LRAAISRGGDFEVLLKLGRHYNPKESGNRLIKKKALGVKPRASG